MLKRGRNPEQEIAAKLTETHRQACEAMWLASYYSRHGKNALEAFLVDVEKHRGKKAADELRDAARREVISRRLLE